MYRREVMECGYVVREHPPIHRGNLKRMLRSEKDPEGNNLDAKQLREIKKTYNMRKEVKRYDRHQK